MSSDVKEQVKTELNRRRLKLWLPPYHEQSGSNRSALLTLAGELKENLPESSIAEIESALSAWQAHALEKINEKNRVSVEFKVLGLQSELDKENLKVEASLAEQVEVTPQSLKFHRINPLLTVSHFLDQLKTLLSVSHVRLVHKGKSLSSNTEARLGDLLVQSGVKQTSVVLCLVSYDKEKDTAASSDQELIASIRNAATKLQSGANFEITDQHGKHVSMLHTERLAFVTALGLHRLGRKRMDDVDNLPSALVFLLEADEEWKHVNPLWLEKVDNYGLLQLDICWVYLKLESLESLPDVERRLQVAERVLRRQVHTNFVTLALVQADMGNAVPPLAAVFVRLFLLQGIAYHYSNDTRKSKEAFDSAWALCQSLRSMSPADAVASLSQAVGTSQFQAISALRRTNGNLDAAATLLEQDEKDSIEQTQKREQQRKIGLCQNAIDLVDLELIPQLQDVLGLPSPPPPKDREAQGAQPKMDTNFKVTAGLLRLANNDLENALSLYQDMERNLQVVLQRVTDLDRKLEAQGITPKRSKKRSRQNDDEDTIMVDEMALATLVSMGVDETTAKNALRHSQNNVEMSLLWLTNEQDTLLANDTEMTMDDEAAGSKPSSKQGEDKDDMAEASLNRKREKEKYREEMEAQHFLKEELEEALQERDMEKEYLGSSLDEEWSFICKFRKD